jgi:hypothetical protein
MAPPQGADQCLSFSSAEAGLASKAPKEMAAASAMRIGIMTKGFLSNILNGRFFIS